MGIYKIEHKRPEDSHFSNLHYVNFLACSLLASDWFKDNQLMSQLTHAHNRDTVPLIQKILASFLFIRGTQRQFSENICSEDDLRSRIFGTFVVKSLACLPLLGFSNIYKMV